MHAYEIYDAPDAALQDELQALDDRLAARAFSTVESEKAARYLRGLIEDELGERRQTMSIFDLLKASLQGGWQGFEEHITACVCNLRLSSTGPSPLIVAPFTNLCSTWSVAA